MTRSRWKSRLLWVSGTTLILALIAGEIGLRSLGIEPFDPASVRKSVVGEIRIEPGGHFVDPDPVLGFVNVAEKIHVVFGDLEFTVTHDADRHRITRPDGAPTPEKADEIFVFGCSFTHGFGVEDHETYPFLLQSAFPDHRVTNAGIESGSTVQAYLECMELWKKGRRPRVVLLGYAGFHEIRNVSLGIRRRELSPLNPFMGDVLVPYARLTSTGEIEIHQDSLRYRPFPLSNWLAIASLVEMVRLSTELEQSRLGEVSRALVKQFAEEAKRREARFLLAGLWPDAKGMLDWCKGEQIECIDLSFDTSTREFLTPSKFDHHPGAKGHQHFANGLIEKLRHRGDGSGDP